MTNLNDYLKNWQGKKTLLVVYPHPDDETMASGGLLLAAKKLGWQTIVVILTKGGAGQIHIHAKGRSLKSIRVEELKKAAQILKVDELIIGDFDDGKLREQKAKWQKWLNEQIAKYDPGIVVTYDHTGITGHPDHISLSVSLRNTQSKLFWSTVPQDFRFLNPLVKEFAPGPTHTLALKGDWYKKYLAASAHKSQALGKGWPVPLWLGLYLYKTEWYHEVEAKKDYKYKYVSFEI